MSPHHFWAYTRIGNTPYAVIATYADTNEAKVVAHTLTKHDAIVLCHKLNELVHVNHQLATTPDPDLRDYVADHGGDPHEYDTP